jgi:hypothetical protein
MHYISGFVRYKKILFLFNKRKNTITRPEGLEPSTSGFGDLRSTN